MGLVAAVPPALQLRQQGGHALRFTLVYALIFPLEVLFLRRFKVVANMGNIVLLPLQPLQLTRPLTKHGHGYTELEQ